MQTRLPWLRIVLILCVLMFPGLSWGLIAPQEPEVRSVSGAIESFLRSRRFQPIHGQHVKNPTQLRTIYKNRDFEPVWSLHRKGLGYFWRDLEEFLQSLEGHGLPVQVYRIDWVETVVKAAKDSGEAKDWALADVVVSDVYFLVSQHLLQGVTDPKRVHGHWFVKPARVDWVDWFEEAASSPRRALKQLHEWLPEDEAYEGLRKALAKYRKLLSKDTWPKLPRVRKKVQKGDQGPVVVALKKRLRASGELKRSQSELTSDVFDQGLEQALKVFQKRHGLNPDGVLGHHTVAALNVSIQERLDQIVVNLERMRQLPREFGDDYIFVNIPDYRVFVFESGKLALTLKGVVGLPKWKTPVFSDEMEYIVINPRWNVPKKIARKEVLPGIQKDNDYITKKNFKVFKKENGKTVKVDPKTVDWAAAKAGDFHFVQKSGGGNSLGRLKFMFPNRYSIYLHDTPSKYLFARDIRSFSHGCIRLEKPLELATHVLKSKKGWKGKDIKKAIVSGKRRIVSLDKKLPIHLRYLTAWVGNDGELQFRKDVYGYDRKFSRALQKGFR